ncbi:MAG: PorT family protein [Cytophagaceae bacterium]|jgi:hypothetical protein|nr:PorT family protein [Cytophagaceae bacterium]
MRTSIVILIFITTLSFAGSAQEKGHTRFSLRVEPVLSWMKSDMENVSSKGSLPGYNLGLGIDHFFGDNYAFATGLTINTTGGKLYYPVVGDIPAFTQTYRLKHIEVPLGLKLRSGDLYRINIYGRFGLSPQINIKASDEHSQKLNSEVRLLELGYHLGGGIEYSLGGKNALIFGLLFNSGFTDVTKRSGFDDKATLSRINFEIGFIF